MAARAASDVERVVAGKRASAVVAFETIVARSREVLAYRDHCDLLRIRHARAHRMAFATADAAMVAVSKYPSEGILRLRRPVVRPELMTGAARSDLLIRRVAAVTVCVRI